MYVYKYFVMFDNNLIVCNLSPSQLASVHPTKLVVPKHSFATPNRFD